MLEPGILHEVMFSVTSDFTAKTVGSGTLDVLATPIMIAKLEQAAWSAVAPHISAESSTVGVLMDVQHTSATPIGMEVTCRAELIEVDGKRLVFQVTAFDESGPIGGGRHERVIIQTERFLAKAQQKRRPSL